MPSEVPAERKRRIGRGWIALAIVLICAGAFILTSYKGMCPNYNGAPYPCTPGQFIQSVIPLLGITLIVLIPVIIIIMGAVVVAVGLYRLFNKE